jgi:hypothetical protein
MLDGLELTAKCWPYVRDSFFSGVRVRNHSLPVREQTKFAALFVSPGPLYLAICG